MQNMILSICNLEIMSALCSSACFVIVKYIMVDPHFYWDEINFELSTWRRTIDTYASIG